MRNFRSFFVLENLCELLRFARHLAHLATLTSCIHVIVIFLLVTLKHNNTPLLTKIAPLWDPGSNGQLLTQTRDADHSGPIDVLFIGPSTAMVTFDPRIFDRFGITSFNLGSDAQTPVNSALVLDRYLNKLKPRLVVIALSPVTLGQNGMESFADFVSNTKVDFPLLHNASHFRTPTTANLLVGASIRNWLRPLELAHQKPFPNRQYIERGYVQLIGDKRRSNFSNVKPFDEINSTQLDWLRKCIARIQASRSKCAVVTCPIAPPLLHRLVHYNSNHEKVNDILAQLNIPFLDWNIEATAPKLSMLDFHDDLHISSLAAPIVNHFVIQWLSREQMLPHSNSLLRASP